MDLCSETHVFREALPCPNSGQFLYMLKLVFITSTNPAYDLTPGPHSGYAPESTQCQLCDVFISQFAFRVSLEGTSEASPTSDRRQKAPLKWLMVQPMRIVLSIANGAPPPMEAAIFEAELHTE